MDYRVLLRVDRTAKLISFSSGDLKVFTDTYSEVDTVFSSSWSADIAGRNNLVILNYYRSEISSETGASFKNSLSDIKIVTDFNNRKKLFFFPLRTKIYDTENCCYQSRKHYRRTSEQSLYTYSVQATGSGRLRKYISGYFISGRSIPVTANV